MSPNIFKDDDASGSATADSKNEGNVASMMHKAGKKLPTFFKRKTRRGSIGNKVGPGSDGDKAEHHHPTKGGASPLEVDVLLSIPSTNSTISALDDDDASHAATLPIRMDKFGFILQDQDGEYYADGSEIGTANNDDAQASNLNQEDGAQCLKGNTPKRSRLVKNFARKGLPNSMRHKAWTIVTGVDAIMAEKEGEYLELVVRSSEMEEGKTSWSVIERDIHRTFPKHYLFQDSALGEDELDGGLEEDVRFAEGGQAALRRLLRAYSAYDSEVGYCQGMNFIAAMFLTFLEEEESFWIFYVVMNEEPYNLRELFREDMAGTHEVLYIAERLIRHFLPNLYKHLENEHIHISMFVTQWLMTIYTSTFPFELVSRVWDSFLVEGWKVVYRTMLALLDHAQQQDLLNLHFEDILTYLREFPSKVDGQSIMMASLKIPLKRRHIQKYAAEWRIHSKNGDIRVDAIVHRPSIADSIDGSLASFRDASAVPNFYKAYHFVSKLKNTSKDIEIDDMSKRLIPVIGTTKFAVMLHNVFTPEECSDLIQKAEDEGFDDAMIQGPGGKQILRTDIRSCQRCMMDDPVLAEDLLDRLMLALAGHTELESKLKHAPWITNKGGDTNTPLHIAGMNERLRYLKYGVDNFFAGHQDNHFRRGPEHGDRAGEISHVTVQIYLNEKFKGGTTRLKGGRRFVDVVPKTGSVLLFDHDIFHEGCKLTSGQKMIIRSDIMYSTTRKY